MISRESFKLLLGSICAFSSGTCEDDGWYVEADDAYNGDFGNGKWFNEGDDFPSGDWVRTEKSLFQ